MVTSDGARFQPPGDGFLDLAVSRYGGRRDGPHSSLVPCPAHRSSSSDGDLHLTVTDEGALLAHCFSQECSFDDILSALRADGLLAPPGHAGGAATGTGAGRNAGRDQERHLAAVYRRSDSGTLKRAYRRDWRPGEPPCSFGECTSTVVHKHCWQSRGAASGWLLLLWAPGSVSPDSAGPVVICEGEKAAAAVTRSGLIGASYVSGAKAAGRADYSPVSGREVVVWPDADSAGHRAGRTAALRSLEAGAASVRMVDVSADPQGADAADFPPETVAERVAAAPLWRPGAGDGSGDGGPGQGGAREPFTGPPDYVAGEFVAHRHFVGRVVHTRRNGWWTYDADGGYWYQLDRDDLWLSDEMSRDRFLYAHELKQSGYSTLAEEVAALTKWRRLMVSDGGYWAALRTVLSGRVPASELNLLNCPNGTVDLRTARLVPHSPAHGCRAVTDGRFLPGEAVRLEEALRDRLEPVLADTAFDAWLDLCALAMTGRAQSYRSFVVLLGASGSGKGGAVQLLHRALGMYSYALPAGWLEKYASEIDATRADLLEREVRLVWLDEIGAQTKMVEQKLLTVLGDSVDNARRAYGKTVEGKHRWMMFTTAVTVPRLSAHGGASRRMAVLPTLGIDLEAEGLKLPDESIDQELLDAVVTLAALRAPAVYAVGYRAPHGDEAAKAEAVAAMDPVSDWLGGVELPSNGLPFSEVYSSALLVFPELTRTELGAKVSAHPALERRKRGDANVVYVCPVSH